MPRPKIYQTRHILKDDSPKTTTRQGFNQYMRDYMRIRRAELKSQDLSTTDGDPKFYLDCKDCGKTLLFKNAEERTEHIMNCGCGEEQNSESEKRGRPRRRRREIFATYRWKRFHQEKDRQSHI